MGFYGQGHLPFKFNSFLLGVISCLSTAYVRHGILLMDLPMIQITSSVKCKKLKAPAFKAPAKQFGKPSRVFGPSACFQTTNAKPEQTL